MKKLADNSIEELIERSSLGTAEARRRRYRVPVVTGQVLAQAAAAKLSTTAET